MKLRSFFSPVFYVFMAAGFALAPATAATDFNIVGNRMSLILQNAHFERLNKKLDKNLSQEIFQNFLNGLDPGHIFFTQGDIDKLNEKYGKELDSYLITSGIMKPTNEVYGIFKKNAIERITYAQKLLEENEFTFDRDVVVNRDRKNAPWPQNKVEAEKLWHDLIEDELLSETLRQDSLTIKTNEGEIDESSKNRLSLKTPSDLLHLRYERLLRKIKNANEEERAEYMLNAVAMVYDPHSNYMNATEWQQFQTEIGGSLVGIGLLMSEDTDGVTNIIGIIKGGAADKSKEVKLKDRIVGIDPDNSGQMIDTLFFNRDKIQNLIKGTEGTTLRLKLESGDKHGETKIVTLSRSHIEMKDKLARGRIIEERQTDGTSLKIGLLSLPAFYVDIGAGGRSSSSDTRRLLERMNEENVEGLIIDLRYNGGGGLGEVNRMGGYFLGRVPIVQRKNPKGEILIEKSINKDPLFTKPIVVLTNKASASASEILAGALQDYGRAIIVGDQSTFGKGTVQICQDIAPYLPYFSDAERAGGLKITTEKFYRVAGGSTQHKGVISDIVLPMTTSVQEIGESYYDRALAYDEVLPVKEYSSNTEWNSLRDQLKQKSGDRVSSDPHFSLVKEELSLVSHARSKGPVSLNMEIRKKEMEEKKVKARIIREDRKAYYSELAQRDEGKYNIYRMTLEDLKSPVLPVETQENQWEQYLKLASDRKNTLDELPKPPAGLDGESREAINILKDLLQLKKHERSSPENLAGIASTAA